MPYVRAVGKDLLHLLAKHKVEFVAEVAVNASEAAVPTVTQFPVEVSAVSGKPAPSTPSLPAADDAA